MAELTISPGFYRLTRDVENPQPDRRQKHDWSAEVVWKKGLLFYVRPSNRAYDYVRIELVGHRWRSQNIAAHGEKGQALIPALVFIAEDFDCVMHRLGVSADNLLAKLYEMEKIELADLDEANRQLELDYTIEDHKNGHHSAKKDKGCPYCQQASKELADVIANLSNDEE